MDANVSVQRIARGCTLGWEEALHFYLKPYLRNEELDRPVDGGLAPDQAQAQAPRASLIKRSPRN